MRKLLIWLPLAMFLAFMVVFAGGLISPESKTIPSKLVGKPMPQFALPAGLAGKPGLSSAELANGQPHLVNFFASWCIPCRAEAPQLEGQAGARAARALALRAAPQPLVRAEAEAELAALLGPSGGA